jgi:hypothetical protein
LSPLAPPTFRAGLRDSGQFDESAQIGRILSMQEVFIVLESCPPRG